MTLVRRKNGFDNPKQIFKVIAVIICICTASYQLAECFRKLVHPPISTHYSFSLNETLDFPAITVCRNPPYKSSIYEKYGLEKGGPTMSAAWRNFNFENYTMEEFFDEATYTFDEIFPFYGFDNHGTNVDVSSFYLLNYGRCFTLTPKNETTKWNSDGYFLYLTHGESERNANKYGVSAYGFHIYIHDRREIFTGSIKNTGSFADYVYGETYEDLHLNLKVQSYEQLCTTDSFCNNSYFYSFSKCQRTCLERTITEEVGCSTPWLPNSNLNQCKDYNNTLGLMKIYYGDNIKNYLNQCACPPACHLKVYRPYIRSRKEIASSNCYLAISFSSNLVTMMTEVLGYDWNLFLSDLGGSLGFLLGISVLGLINMFEQLISALKRARDGEMNAQNDQLNCKTVVETKKLEKRGNTKKKERQQAEVRFNENRHSEETVIKNNASSEYFDNNKHQNNHTKYIYKH